MMNKQQEKFFICKCDCTSHLIRVTYCKWDNGDEEFVVSPILNHYLGFWGRLKIAFKYLFGILHDDWAYDTVLLSRTQAQELRDFINSTILVNENIR